MFDNKRGGLKKLENKKLKATQPCLPVFEKMKVGDCQEISPLTQHLLKHLFFSSSIPKVNS